MGDWATMAAAHLASGLMSWQTPPDPPGGQMTTIFMQVQRCCDEGPVRWR